MIYFLLKPKTIFFILETLQIFGQCVMSGFAWAARGDEAKYR